MYRRFLKNVKMGLFGDIKNATTGGISQGIGGGVGGLVGGLFGMIGQKKREKRYLNMQKELQEQAAKTNYEYGEKAAENAYRRQMEMYERSYEDQSYKAMRKQMEDAGLSVGLMYGHSGSGGGAGAMTGAPIGATGAAGAGQADTPATQQMAKARVMEVGLAAREKQAQIQLLEASAKKAEAEAKQSESETKTTESSREDYLELLRNQGFNSWLDAVGKEYQMTGEGSSDYETVNAYTGKKIKITNESYLSQSRAMEITQLYAQAYANEASGKAAEAMAKLTGEKVKGYWQELLNATIAADSGAQKAAAEALAKMWEIGEHNNWKTWWVKQVEDQKVAEISNANAIKSWATEIQQDVALWDQELKQKQYHLDEREIKRREIQTGFDTGTLTNWKTWTELGTKVIGSAKGANGARR